MKANGAARKVCERKRRDQYLDRLLMKRVRKLIGRLRYC